MSLKFLGPLIMMALCIVQGILVNKKSKIYTDFDLKSEKIPFDISGEKQFDFLLKKSKN